MACEVCGTPLGIVDATEREDEDGIVTWFREKYECEGCGSVGWLEVDQSGGKVPDQETWGDAFDGRSGVA